LVTAEKKTDNSPDFRVLTGALEIGAAWKKSKEDRTCLSLILDDPSFGTPIYPILTDAGGHTFELICTAATATDRATRAFRFRAERSRAVYDRAGQPCKVHLDLCRSEPARSVTFETAAHRRREATRNYGSCGCFFK
jgi:uncharacterized protein DUF736